jgi:hypothetical protein
VLRNEEAVDAVCCVFAEMSDLSFIATKGNEQPVDEPVMRDKKKGSAPRHIPQTARRGEAGGGGGGARVREPSSHTLLPQGEELTLYVGPTPSKLAR